MVGLLTEVARRLRKESTPAERHLWKRLRAHRLNGYRFKRQQPIDGYVVDFACPQRRLVVEVDGEYHDAQAQEDRQRTSYLEARGYRVLRFSNEEVLEDIEEVLEKIKGGLSPNPSP